MPKSRPKSPVAAGSPHPNPARVGASVIEPYKGCPAWEPSIAVHDIFTQPLPGAFELEFLERLLQGISRLPGGRRS